MSEKNIIELDYVYEAVEMFDYRNVRVSVAVSDAAVVISLYPDLPMEIKELNEVLAYIEADMIKKSRIDIVHDCVLTLTQDGQTYRIELDGQTPRVKALRLGD
jgi:hypothetical protein